MKAVRLVILLLLFAIVLTFAYQNLERINVTFITWSITAPFSLTIFLSFIIGVIAGGLAIFSSKKKKKDDDVNQAEAKSDKTENSV